MSERIVNTNDAAMHVTDSGVAEQTLVLPHYWGRLATDTARCC